MIPGVPAELVPSRCWPIVKSSLLFVNYALAAVFEGGRLYILAMSTASILINCPISALLVMMAIKAYKACEL